MSTSGKVSVKDILIPLVHIIVGLGLPLFIVSILLNVLVSGDPREKAQARLQKYKQQQTKEAETGNISSLLRTIQLRKDAQDDVEDVCKKLFNDSRCPQGAAAS